jgi:hypothetical protein
MAVALESRPPGLPPLAKCERKFLRLLLFALCIAACPAIAVEPAPPPAKVPALIELRDQFDAPQKLAFPTTNVVVLTIADHKGSEQIDGWIAALKTRFARRIELRGLADVRGVPGLWRGKVRKKFRETRTHPVMLDWSGTNCALLGCAPGVANVLVLARDGAVQGCFTGAATEAALKEACAAIELALAAEFSVNSKRP